MKKKILLILFLLPISISCTNEAIDKIQPLLDNINNQIKSSPKSKTNSKVAHINGTITDENNNKISDVKIKIDDKETKSDSSGYYAINDLAIGKTRIIALKDGYEENNMTVDLKEDIQTINIKLKKSFIIVKPTSNIQVSSSPSIIPTSLITPSHSNNPTPIQTQIITPTQSITPTPKPIVSNNKIDKISISKKFDNFIGSKISIDNNNNIIFGLYSYDDYSLTNLYYKKFDTDLMEISKLNEINSLSLSGIEAFVDNKNNYNVFSLDSIYKNIIHKVFDNSNNLISDFKKINKNQIHYDWSIASNKNSLYSLLYLSSFGKLYLKIFQDNNILVQDKIVNEEVSNPIDIALTENDKIIVAYTKKYEEIYIKIYNKDGSILKDNLLIHKGRVGTDLKISINKDNIILISWSDMFSVFSKLIDINGNTLIEKFLVSDSAERLYCNYFNNNQFIVSYGKYYKFSQSTGKSYYHTLIKKFDINGNETFYENLSKDYPNGGIGGDCLITDQGKILVSWFSPILKDNNKEYYDSFLKLIK